MRQLTTNFGISFFLLAVRHNSNKIIWIAFCHFGDRYYCILNGVGENKNPPHMHIRQEQWPGERDIEMGGMQNAEGIKLVCLHIPCLQIVNIGKKLGATSELPAWIDRFSVWILSVFFSVCLYFVNIWPPGNAQAIKIYRVILPNFETENIDDFQF